MPQPRVLPCRQQLPTAVPDPSPPGLWLTGREVLKIPHTSRTLSFSKFWVEWLLSAEKQQRAN